MMRNEILQVFSANYSKEENINESYVSIISKYLSEMTSPSSSSDDEYENMRNHFNDHDTEIAIVSADRHKSGETEEQRTARNERQRLMLKKHLDDNNFNYIEAKGGYIEKHGTPDAVPVHERSFIVINKKGTPNFRPEGLLNHFKRVSGSEPISNDLGENTEQESIIHKPLGTDIADMHYVSGDNAGKSSILGKFQNDSGAEYFTEMKDGRRFELR